VLPLVSFAIHVRVDGTDWVAVATAVATAALALAGWIALISLKDARRTRHAAIIADLSRRWDEPRATAARRRTGDYEPAALRDLVLRIYRPDPSSTEAERLADVEELFRLGRWLNVLETVGVLYTEKALSDKVIFKLWAGQLVSAWAKWEPTILTMRDLERRPGIYENFEKLENRMRQLLAKELRRERSSRGGHRADSERSEGAGYSARSSSASPVPDNTDKTKSRALRSLTLLLSLSAVVMVYRRSLGRMVRRLMG
jgi:hypothetical protein